MRLLSKSSLFPASPDSTKWSLFFCRPPKGQLSLNGHKKLLASLKWGPTVRISWMRSSIHIMPNFPSAYTKSTEFNRSKYCEGYTSNPSNINAVATQLLQVKFLLSTNFTPKPFLIRAPVKLCHDSYSCEIPSPPYVLSTAKTIAS